MLVLGRRKGQKIKIGENVTLVVLDVNLKSAKLGFEAPKDVIVDREEIVIRKKKEQEDEKNRTHEN